MLPGLSRAILALLLVLALTPAVAAQQLFVANPGTSQAAPSIEMFVTDVRAFFGGTTPGLVWSGSAPMSQGAPQALALGPRWDTWRYTYGTLYALGSGGVLQFGFDTRSSALTFIGSVPVGVLPRAMLATGPNLYVANRGSDSISVFAINQSNGSLTLLQTVTGVTTPTEMAFDPAQNLLVTSGGTRFCSLRVQPDGTLTLLQCTAPHPAPAPLPSRMVFVGSVLYGIINGTVYGQPFGALHAWRIDPATGTFTQAAPQLQFGFGVSLYDIAAVPGVDAIYVSRHGAITIVTPATSGSLSVVGTFFGIGTPARMLGDARRRLFVTDPSQNQVLSLTINADTTLSNGFVAAGQPGQGFPMSMALFVR
jgi:hypothetical protein